ncbi:MAG TPA: (d)CMP kinase [Syntrophales bacterium]|nr:(d)CMP kinase [Syntrophobacterales bacterium]HNQ01862.1 (d)CMP kinase [Syntrophales bacterium]HQL89749.1 (d)CMP kinase [Syntrophales bacterium]
MTKRYVVTVDGPAGSGKSTVSRLLARELSCVYLDTGALYRAVALKVSRAGLAPDDRAGIAALCAKTAVALAVREGATRVLLDGQDVTEEIRTPAISMLASTVSALPEVRQRLLAVQREAAPAGGIVAEGRDMGTVVFPGADVKFFLTAGPEERGRRRWLELKQRGHEVELAEVIRDVARRDRQDSGREIAPLRPSGDAVLVDSTGKSVEEVVQEMLRVIKGKGNRVF